MNLQEQIYLLNGKIKQLEEQSDWNEADIDAPSYIKNKPDFSDFKVYYVDGNNPNAGDGSVIAPFKTIQDAINAVIGTGTRDNPEYTDVCIKVASFSYNFTGNLWVNRLSYIFDVGAIINYTATGYLIDNQGFNHTHIFKVSGRPTINITQGGFIRNIGPAMSITTGNRIMDIEVYDVYSTTPLGGGTDPNSIPLIVMEKTAADGGYAGPITSIRVHYRLVSGQQTALRVRGACSMNIVGIGNKPLFSYGGTGNALTPGHINGKLVDFNSTEIGSRRYFANLSLNNLTLAGEFSSSLIYLEGYYGNPNGGIYYCNFGEARGGARVERLIEFGNWEAANYSGGAFGRFIISNTYNPALTCNQVDVIRFTGITPSLNKLDMHNVILRPGEEVNANVNISGNIGNSVNQFGGRIHFSNLPIFASNIAALSGGLKVGHIYKTSQGQLYIVS